MSTVLALASGLPEHRYSQMELWAYMVKTLDLDERMATKLRRLYAQSGIEFRHSVLPDFAQDAGFFSVEPPSLQARMARYHEAVMPLAQSTAKRCLQAYPEAQITHLIAVSCTGLAAPGFDLMLMRQLNLPLHTMRTGIYYLGCYAALHALKLAHAICESETDAQVLIVSAELCTLHFQWDISLESLTSALLFADGAAALLLGADRFARSGDLQFKSFASGVDFSGWEAMSWHPAETGFLMHLAPEVPTHLQQHARPLFERALAAQHLAVSDVEHWCIHPGGRKILDVLSESLSLVPEALDASRAVLRQCGNMSSPTVLFVLEQLRSRWQSGEWVCAAAFGPGLTLETALGHVV